MLWLATVLQSLTVLKRLKFTNLSKVYDIAIIGGGAAGLYAAAALSSYNKEKGRLDVMLLEKMHRCGLKIGITGKGRCNLTNTKPWNEFSTHIHPKNVFLKNAFYASSNTAVMENFEKMGLPLVVERGDRVFPQSMKALDVVSTLERHILQGGIQLRKNSEVSSLAKGEDGLFVIKCSDGFDCQTRKVIISTGGLSYQTTGSSGDGYVFAKGLGHKITPLFPSCSTTSKPLSAA